jgi:phytanoyl-CoA hydroxylase
MADLLSEQQWWEYQQSGYLRLGAVLEASELTALQRRMDEIMLGQVSYPALRYQLDTGGAYEDLPDAVPHGSDTTLAYRKVQGLEADPLVLEVMRRPVFREICDRHYGKHARISIFRAMMMNKPAGKGTYLPWHQDGGDV